MSFAEKQMQPKIIISKLSQSLKDKYLYMTESRSETGKQRNNGKGERGGDMGQNIPSVQYTKI